MLIPRSTGEPFVEQEVVASPTQSQSHAHPTPLQSSDQIPPESIIQDLCEALRAERSKYGRLGGRDFGSDYTLESIDARTMAVNDGITSLQSLLANPNERFNRVARYSLALALARAHTNLHPSGWLGSGWSSDEIMILGDDLNRPFLRRSFSACVTATTSQPLDQRLAFFTLGVTILELCFGKTLQQSGYLRQPGQERTVWGKLTAAYEWELSVNGEAGAQFAEAVGWLLGQNQPKPSWREDMRQNAVDPLRLSLEALKSPGSRVHVPSSTFVETAKNLLHKVEAKRANELAQQYILAIQDIGDTTTVAREVFDENEELLEELFIVAEFERRATPSDDSSDTAWREDTLKKLRANHTIRRFRKTVIGDGPQNSRARILSIMLTVMIATGTSPQSLAWRSFLGTLGLGSDLSNTDESLLKDANLPFINDLNLSSHLGGKSSEKFSEEFAKVQYEYCPPIRNNFDRQWSSLATTFNEAMNTYEAGDDDSHYYESWCSGAGVEEFIQNHESTIKSLYLDWVKYTIHHSSDSISEKWRIARDAEQNADSFFEGLLPRSRVFATLIYIRVAGGSDVWRNFAHVCRYNASDSGLLDSGLPFDEHEIKALDADSYWRTQFLNNQMRFCVATIKQHDKDDKSPQHRIVLPLLERKLLGEGASGKVFKVKIKAGYFTGASGDIDLAMKQIPAGYVREPHHMQWLFEQSRRHQAIVTILACVETPDHICMFMDLANCDLYKYMTCTAPKGPPSQDRKMMFNFIIDIADALQYLQNNLLYGEEREVRVLFHQDLKSENILVTLEDPDKPKPVRFQIADFGIATIKRVTLPKDGAKVFRNRYSAQPSRTHLGEDQRNIAPELLLDDGHVTAESDIWAFGTMFAEYSAWLFGGNACLQEFEQQREGAHENHLSFSVASGTGKPILKPGIESFDNFATRAAFGDCSEATKIFQSSWWLLKKKLLVCEPRHRADIKDVYNILTKILRGDEYPGPKPRFGFKRVVLVLHTLVWCSCAVMAVLALLRVYRSVLG